MDECDENIINKTIIPDLLDQYKAFNRLTLDEVVRTSLDRSVKAEKVIKDIYTLEKNNRLTLIDPNFPKDFFNYFLSGYSVLFWIQLLFIVFFYFVTYYFVYEYPTVFIKYISSFLFILFIPGYALLNAIYYKKGEVERVQKISYILVISIVITAIIGLILNYSPWGINSYLYYLIASFMSIIFNIYSLYKKYHSTLSHN
jgi:hypothetical protein